MKHFFKILLITIFLLGILESCSSGEDTIQTTSEEKISSSLIEKIIATTTSINDYNLINFNCGDMSVVGGFLNKQGDYYGAFTIKISEWSDFYESNKNTAFNQTGIQFTDDDYILHYLIDFNGSLGILVDEENFINYFNDCSFDGDIKFFHEDKGTIAVSEINYNCLGKAKYFVNGVDDSSITNSPIPFEEGLTAVSEALTLYNAVNNSEYTIEQLRISFLEYVSPKETEYIAIGRSQMINYFEDCVLDRDTDDCINFKYPFIINKINLQTKEIVPITINNDSELNQNFFDQIEDLTIDYPITLVTLNGSEVIIKSNEELETALTNSAAYCHDEW